MLLEITALLGAYDVNQTMQGRSCTLAATPVSGAADAGRRGLSPWSLAVALLWLPRLDAAVDVVVDDATARPGSAGTRPPGRPF
ncbi:hypothetical protein GUJ93_ZPchr0007g4807 [Zizania palustris]|uniref:Uncharacterized protein n=1 Tax=Zizania palustris TaxID=103762 RepID=A0A8J5W5B0_ZIZPA|nr:hypothetical protein GUJ93_ZPchr0007g4807 [Zizania palustris]